MGFDFNAKLDEANGAGGKLPITPEEWARVGIDGDRAAWGLLDYAYKTITSSAQTLDRCMATFEYSSFGSQGSSISSIELPRRVE